MGEAGAYLTFYFVLLHLWARKIMSQPIHHGEVGRKSLAVGRIAMSQNQSCRSSAGAGVAEPWAVVLSTFNVGRRRERVGGSSSEMSFCGTAQAGWLSRNRQWMREIWCGRKWRSMCRSSDGSSFMKILLNNCSGTVGGTEGAVQLQELNGRPNQPLR